MWARHKSCLIAGLAGIVFLVAARAADQVELRAATTYPSDRMAACTCVIAQVHEHATPSLESEAPMMESEATSYHPCCSGALTQSEQGFLGIEGGPAVPILPANAIQAPLSTGERSVLYLRVAFPDALLEPQTEAAAHSMLSQVNAWFVESSYGRVSLLATVPPLIVLPRTEAWYKSRGSEYDLANDATFVGNGMGYDSDGFDHVIFAYQGGPGNFQGQGTISGKTVWLRQINAGSCAHELGHNLGLWHANSWETSGQSIIGPGTNLEYGNSYDWMGGARLASGDFNTVWKNRIAWLTDEFIHDIHQSGIYRVHACDTPALDPTKRYALTVRKDAQRQYWGEFRQEINPSSPSLNSGLLLNWSPWSQSAGGTHLLDTTPGTAGGKSDAALTIGLTLSDAESGVHITPVGKGGTSPESLDVVVNVGAFESNLPPIVTVSASQINVPPGEVVTFAAHALDSDNDNLAYFWDFGDGAFSSDNRADASKSWNTAGRYVVRCLVSDMKGGMASDSVIIGVGSPTNFLISGRITADAQPLVNVRVHNGLSGNQYRGTYTDSDGTFALSDLNAGNVTLSALLMGYSFTPDFTNPVTLGPDFTMANFMAQPVVPVSIATIDPIATEGGDPATIRLSRGGSTASSLGVAVAGLEGPIRAEYNMEPESNFIPSLRDYGFVIPAGQSSVDILITALSDEEMEGPETLTIQIRSADGYVVSGPNSASVTFFDSGSSLPLVSVSVLDRDASESGDGASFQISRLGSTDSALMVQCSLSGSAANGIDYSAMVTNVVIVSGETSTTLVITPINDAGIEGAENVTLALSAIGNYLVSQSGQQAEAFIVDDDVPTLSIVATDTTASETGQDPAIFVVTRSGDTSAPLAVNYALAGSALNGADYDVLPGVLTIPAGSSAGSITIVPIDDEVGEPVQTIVVQLGSSSRYIVGGTGNATASLMDNDVPSVSIGVSDGTAGEPADAGQFKFTTGGSGSGNITVRYTVAGNAIPGVDYVELSGTLLMGRNTTATVTVTPLDDGDPENLESVTVTIDADAAYSAFLDSTATLNLLDNEWNIVSVTPGNSSFDESGGDTMNFYISRQGSRTNALTVHYTMNGTAINGVDYVDNLSGIELPGSLTIPAGQAGADVRARIINDSLIEGTETATFTLTSNVAYGLGIASATQYLPDDEVPEIYAGFASSIGGGSENVGTVSIPVMLNATSAGPVTVEYAIAGGTATGGIDYSLARGVLTFAPGVTSTNILLSIIDDAFVEPAQTVIVVLRNAHMAALGTSTYTYTISDNDSPPPVTVGFTATTSAASENVTSVELLVSLSAAQPAPVTVHYAPIGGTATGGGIDYTLSPEMLTFAPGETVKTIPITIFDDTLGESNETIMVTLDSPIGAVLNANTTHTLTVSNTAPVVRIRQITATSEGVALQFAGIPGLVYAIERSIDLESWSAIAVMTAPSSGVFEFSDPSPLSQTAFYRMRTTH